jgi:flagellar biosynthesis/type III secretory pathway M-ring protein FliF/YscJ
MSGLSARVIAMVAAVFVLIVAVGLFVRSCDKRRSQAAQGRVERSQAEASSNSAKDAINAVGAANGRETASEDLTRSNEKDIRNAEGSNAAVNPAARDAGLRALCLRPAYRDSERCKLLGAPPR